MRQFLLALKQAVQTTADEVTTAVEALATEEVTDDETAPQPPTGLAGTCSAGVIRLTWLNPADTDLAKVEVWESATDVQPDPEDDADMRLAEVVSVHDTNGEYLRTGLTTGDVRYYWVRAVDTSGNASAFNATPGVRVEYTLNVDTGTLGPPTGVTAIGGFQSIWLHWTNVVDFNLRSVQVYENTTNNSAGAVLIGTTTAITGDPGSYYRGGIGTSQTRYYWLRSVDLDGSVSVFSSPAASATTGTIDPAELGTAVAFNAPVGLNVNSNLTTDTDGHQIATVTIAWAQISDPRFSFYEVAISENGGSYIVFPTSDVNYNLRAKANTSYNVKVRGVDRNGNRTNYSTVYSHTSVSKTAAPSAASTLSMIVGIGSVYLSWTNPSDPELAGTDIYEGTGGPYTKVATVNATPGQIGKFSRVGLPTDALRYYYVVSRDSTGNVSAASNIVSNTTAKVLSGDIAVDNVLANNVVANITTTNVLNANVLQSASSLPAALSISGTGFSLATLTTAAADPAAVININTTLVEPGQIQISGASTLASWRDGSDLTKITGGKIAANSITANSLMIGAAGVEVIGLVFEHNTTVQGSDSYTSNNVAWSAGLINYNGAASPVAVSAGYVAYAGAPVYIYWVKDSGSLSTTTSGATAYGANNIILATYAGGVKLNANYGGTVIDGSNIKTGTVTANNIAAGTITADKIGAGEITADNIRALTINADNILSNSLTTSGGAGTSSHTALGASEVTVYSEAVNNFDTNSVASSFLILVQTFVVNSDAYVRDATFTLYRGATLLSTFGQAINASHGSFFMGMTTDTPPANTNPTYTIKGATPDGTSMSCNEVSFRYIKFRR